MHITRYRSRWSSIKKVVGEEGKGLTSFSGRPKMGKTLSCSIARAYCACGIPVIATAYADSLIAEFIRKHEIGATSPPLDEEKLAEAIYQLYKNESFREAAGKRARTLIEEKFDRNKIAEDFLNSVKHIVYGRS